MPFGIRLAPEVFKRRLQECLADLPGVKVIRDDILVVRYGETDEEALLDHDQNVVRLLNEPKKSRVKQPQAKVKFFGLLCLQID